MGVNVIITCPIKECQYCHEGECGKHEIFIDDNECLYLKGKFHGRENDHKRGSRNPAMLV